jgi:hypothetical protein
MQENSDLSFILHVDVDLWWDGQTTMMGNMMIGT